MHGMLGGMIGRSTGLVWFLWCVSLARGRVSYAYLSVYQGAEGEFVRVS